MSPDVVIPVFRDVVTTEACIRSVLECSPMLGRLWLINDCSPESAMHGLLEGFRLADHRVRLFAHQQNLGFVRTANLGLAASSSDVVVLNSDTRVRPGWLEGLVDVFREYDDVAAVSPLTNNGGMCSVPKYGQANELTDEQVERFPLTTLPRFTSMPTAPGFCLFMRRKALADLGPFDPAFGFGYHEENDWCARARKRGWRVGRANRVFVWHLGATSFGASRALRDERNGWRLAARHPEFFAEARAFDATDAAHVAARALS